MQTSVDIGPLATFAQKLALLITSTAHRIGPEILAWSTTRQQQQQTCCLSVNHTTALLLLLLPPTNKDPQFASACLTAVESALVRLSISLSARTLHCSSSPAC
jgi:hypothetical protein